MARVGEGRRIGGQFGLASSLAVGFPTDEPTPPAHLAAQGAGPEDQRHEQEGQGGEFLGVKRAAEQGQGREFSGGGGALTVSTRPAGAPGVSGSFQAVS